MNDDVLKVLEEENTMKVKYRNAEEDMIYEEQRMSMDAFFDRSFDKRVFDMEMNAFLDRKHKDKRYW